MKFGIGQPVPRTEDPRFLKGRGRYTDDLAPPGLAYGYVLRSPHAHARIKAIDTEKAKQSPGVLLVLTGADIKAAGLGSLPCGAPPVAFGGPLKVFMGLHPILAQDRVRHVGDPVRTEAIRAIPPDRRVAHMIIVHLVVSHCQVDPAILVEVRRDAP